MKKRLMLVLALLFISGTVFAQVGGYGYIGLFTDDTHSEWCVTGVGMYPVEMWICCLPSYMGQMCAEFMISYPPTSDVIQSTVTANEPIISVSLGSLPTGMSVCYVECQRNWHWCFHQSLYVLTTARANIEIVEHPDAGVYQFTNCNPEGYELESVERLNCMMLNLDQGAAECILAVQESTWGAIKNMFSE